MGRRSQLTETKRRERFAVHTNPGRVDQFEFSGPENPPVLLKQVGLLGGADSGLIADSQLVPALRTPASQHRPAVRRLHANTESVRLRALTVVGLKCAFWHLSSLSNVLGVGAQTQYGLTHFRELSVYTAQTGVLWVLLAQGLQKHVRDKAGCVVIRGSQPNEN